MSGRVHTARASGRRRLASNATTRDFFLWLGHSTLWFLRCGAGFVLAFGALALCVLGIFRDGAATFSHLAALGGISCVLLARLLERVRGQLSAWQEAELGTLFIAATFAIIELVGGTQGLLYPLVFALVAFLVAFHPLRLGAYFVMVILGAETAIALHGRGDTIVLASHASFILLFGVLYALFLRREVRDQRDRVARSIRGHLDEIHTAAREYRLTSGLSQESRDLTAEELLQRRRVGSVQAIQESLYGVLAVAEKALTPHTVALLWLDLDEKHLRVKEVRSACDRLRESPIHVAEGLVGVITKQREPLIMSQVTPRHAGLAYYDVPPAVTDFAGVPVLEGRHLRGVLVVDRIDGRPFGPDDLTILTTIAEEIVRVVKVERVLSEMDTEKYRRERLYEASRAFNHALTTEQVANVAIAAAKKLTHADVAIAIVATSDEGVLRVQAATDGEDLIGHTFVADGTLVGAAIRARHALPLTTLHAKGHHIMGHTFDDRVAHVKVLPLLWKDTGVGALVVASYERDFLTFDALDMLRVIADHAAIAIANAQMYERMEHMATTDGLTGLVNHRYFQTRFDEHLARAERYGRRLSLLLVDVDHFKQINDSYGHPMGDIVLKRLARVLERNARKTDVVARYGGEEFAVLLDETDNVGAMQIAERIRQAVEAEPFQSDTARFTCTLSLGIATYPDVGRQKARLIALADEALYEAKRCGRNRVVTSQRLSA